jgi:hypothetical protein
MDNMANFNDGGKGKKWQHGYIARKCEDVFLPLQSTGKFASFN